MRFSNLTYSGWGRTLSATADIARPERVRDAVATVAESARLVPVGRLRSYGDAALAANGAGIRTDRLDRYLSFDETTGVLEVEAGVQLGQILRTFAPKGWMPPVLPGTGFTSVGGAIANDVHGKNHHEAGSFGAHVEAITLVGPDGAIREVTPADDALFRATLGGVGQTGVILAAKLKLAPCPSTEMRVEERRIPNLRTFLEAFETSEAPFQVGWIDALARGKALGRGIFESGRFAQTAPEPFAPERTKKVPMTPPGFFLSAPIVRAFNWLYFQRVPLAGRTRRRPLPHFFFPLDAVHEWNRLYGKAGFHQFQCVVPMDVAETALTDMLSTIAAAGIASPLAVIKKMGPGRAGYMSFPMEGITLAVDLPHRGRTMSVLADLNRKTVEHGGRIYFAKDSSAPRASLGAMYPELEDYRAVVAKADPDAKFASQLSRRLDLRGAA